jgi:UDP-N-acetylglucosamine 2-epimerase (non-hydrolysing)
VSLLLTDADEYQRRQLDRNPYGDGYAAKRIIDAVAARSWENPDSVRRAA